MNERVEKVFVNLSKIIEWLLALGLISGGGVTIQARYERTQTVEKAKNTVGCLDNV
jgi:hypothetical protein